MFKDVMPIRSIVLQSSNDSIEPSQVKKISIPLTLAMERQLYQRQEPPIETLTWFRMNATIANDDANAISYQNWIDGLQQRWFTIVKANPWLCGRLISQGSHAVLEYPESVPSLKENGLFRVVPSEQSPVSRKTPIQNLATTMQDWLLKATPLVQLTVLPSQEEPTKYVAVLFSLNHIVADIHVYYGLYHMLLGQRPIQSLNMQPKADILESQARQWIGNDMFDFCNSPLFLVKGALGFVDKFVVRPLSQLLSSTTATSPDTSKSEVWYTIDLTALQVEKERYMSNNDLNTKSKDTFVSTNDILTSWFFATSKCTVGLLCVNYRARFATDNENSLGCWGRNLWGTQLYQPGDLESPRQIRQWLIQDRHRPPPSAWDFVQHGSIAVSTNWVSAAKTDNSRFSSLSPDVHCPLFDFGRYCPSNFVVMRIYQVTSSTTGVYLAGDPLIVKRLMDSKPDYLVNYNLDLI